MSTLLNYLTAINPFVHINVIITIILYLNNFKTKNLNNKMYYRNNLSFAGFCP